MKILLLGKAGQVGWELQRALAPLGDLTACGRADADFCQTNQLVALLRRHQPDIVVNAAAYTAVDLAESQPDLAAKINTEAVSVLASEAQSRGAWLVHFSTDYVFDGSGQRAWTEEDPTEPLNVYGRSKLEGERAVRASNCAHLILRTGWVYAGRGENFALGLLRKAANATALRVVNDQFGAPTSAELLADSCAHALRVAMARPEVAGTYHVAATGSTHWHGYACHLIETARSLGWPVQLQATQIEAVASAAWLCAAKRPLNGRLDTRKFCQMFGLNLPDWRIGVDRLLGELTPAVLSSSTVVEGHR